MARRLHRLRAMTSLDASGNIRGPRMGTEDATLVERLRRRAAQHGERPAVAFLEASGETEAWSYAMLDARARAWAAVLGERGLEGERVLLALPSRLDLVAAFWGCLYARAIAVPAYPAAPSRAIERLVSILRSARPAAIVADATCRARLTRALGSALDETRWIDPSEVPLDAASAYRAPSIDARELAFLQYTSGSTGTPRGVAVTHRALRDNVAIIAEAFELDERTRGMIWLPLHHDMGLIGGLLAPLAAGGLTTLFPAGDFVQRPLRWLTAISRHGATVSGGPSFAYELCVRRIAPEARAGLDLRSWRVAFNAAEPVRAETIRAFEDAFAPHGFDRRAWLPCYGLAESTLFVAGRRSDTGPRIVDLAGVREVGTAPRVSMGRWHASQDVRIVDPETCEERPVGTVGEIWVHGSCAEGGYFDDPSATEATFGARLAGDAAGTRYLRTGDLGLVDEHGELFVTGRRKEMIIAQARNLYPSDLERVAASVDPALTTHQCVAFGVDGTMGEDVVLLVETSASALAADELAKKIRAALAEVFDVRVRAVEIVRLGAILRTTSGKAQRGACRARWVDAQAGGLHSEASHA